MFFVLDQGQLDTNKVGITPTLILDQNELDTYGISYNGYNSDLAYDSNLLTYDGAFVWQATASAQLNALTALATSVTAKFASANSSLGALQAQASEAIENFAHGSANLQNLISTAQITVLKQISASSDLGSALSSANLVIQKQATANADLGSMLADSNAEVDNFYTASANFGALTATAQTEQPVPPTPEPQLYGSNPYYKQVIKKKVKPQPEPKIKVIIEPPKEFPPLIKTSFAKINTNLADSDISAESVIEFSILEDEAELLLLI